MAPMKGLQPWLTLCAALCLAACDSPALGRMSDSELSRKADECRNTNAPAAILAAQCRSVKKECERRARELHVYVCG